MSTKAKSRWANDEEDVTLEAQRKQEKEEKKRAKAEKQRKLEEASTRPRASVAADSTQGAVQGLESTQESGERPTKRRRLSAEPIEADSTSAAPRKLLHFPAPEWGPCRHVDNFEMLNHIEEGSYGWVSRAREIATGEVVALKKLKMDNSYDGFPVTGLREIQTLMASRHTNIVNFREVVMGDSMNE